MLKPRFTTALSLVALTALAAPSLAHASGLSATVAAEKVVDAKAAVDAGKNLCAQFSCGIPATAAEVAAKAKVDAVKAAEAKVAEVKVEPKAETKVEPKVEAKTDAKPEMKVEATAEVKPAPEATHRMPASAEHPRR